MLSLKLKNKYLTRLHDQIAHEAVLLIRAAATYSNVRQCVHCRRVRFLQRTVIYKPVAVPRMRTLIQKRIKVIIK